MVSLAGSDASRTVIDVSRGVVAHTSLVAATYCKPSGDEGSATQAPRVSLAASTAHTSELARLPTYTSPAPTVAELGPTTRLAPFFPAFSTVGKPSMRVSFPVAVSSTSTLPVSPAGIHTRPAARSTAR